MTQDEQKKEGFITLKEASERFGYAPDYIGQLIRKGKIEGKQVYANVAWMTTPEAIEEYLSKEKRTGKSEKDKQKFTRERVEQILFTDRTGGRIVSIVLYAVISLLVVVFLMIFYFLSIANDHRLEERAKARLEEVSLQNSIQETTLIPSALNSSERLFGYAPFTI